MLRARIRSAGSGANARSDGLVEVNIGKGLQAACKSL